MRSLQKGDETFCIVERLPFSGKGSAAGGGKGGGRVDLGTAASARTALQCSRARQPDPAFMDR